MQPQKIKPLVGPNRHLPEITVKAVILAIILVVVLCAGNAYLGLKVGTTISASIPAAVISMAVLRMFRHSNVLENNIVQTAASVGESTAAGIAFVLPALLLIHYWHFFHFWATLVIALLGGCLGMLFSIPLRRVLIDAPGLKYPEGTAIGAVLKASAKEGSDIKPLMYGGLVGALINFCQNGLKFVSNSMQFWFNGKGFIWGLGLGFSPALLAAGYIVGVNVAISVGIGVILGWAIGMPVLTSIYGVPHAATLSGSAADIWNVYIRHIGVGTMLIGGLWTVLTLFKPIYHGIAASFQSLRVTKMSNKSVPRTEKDIPINLTFALIGVLLVLACIAFYFEINPVVLGIGEGMRIAMSVAATLFILFGGFLFASISAYFAGLIGSTNNPASGLLISAIMIFSVIVLLIFGVFSHFSHARELSLAGFVVMVCSVVGAAITISNDTMQDLKAGQIVGATPWKQQVMLIVGVVVAAFVIAPVLELLFNAYGMGGIFPHPGMPRADMLAAPQAGLMAAVLQGVFAHKLAWAMLISGGVIAVIAICIDEWLKPRGLRLPVLAIGLGIYLPLNSSMPIVVGGFISYFATRAVKKRIGAKRFSTDKAVRKQLHRTLLAACGIVAGASIMGVILAIPFAIARNANVLSIVGPNFVDYANVLGFAASVWVCWWLFRTVTKKAS